MGGIMGIPFLPRGWDKAANLFIEMDRRISNVEGNSGQKISHTKLGDIEDHDHYIKDDGSRKMQSPLDMGRNPIKNATNRAFQIHFDEGEVRIDKKKNTLFVNSMPDWFHKEYTAENAGLVTIPAATISIATLDLGTVRSGDIINVEYGVTGIKGVTEGSCGVLLQKSSGTATIQMFKDKTSHWNRMAVFANDGWNIIGSIEVTITAPGTLVMDITGDSNGSDSSCAAGDGQIRARFIRKQ
jgi:hypothetical protein